MKSKIEKQEIPDSEEKILNEIFEPTISEWWIEKFGKYVEKNGGCFTPPQREAIPHINEGKNTLICSPTGSGKTLSSFASIINELFKLTKQEELENSVYCLYISPLKSLANDIKRNLERPLKGIKEIVNKSGDDYQEIRQAIRHGDTPRSERSKMLEKSPHILNTTPETLAILLNSPKFKKKLENVRWVIVDEIHSLAESKRGVHLSLSLERLQAMADNEIIRIGCSATVEPLEKVSRFLCGQERNYEIVDARFIREMDIKLKCPTEDLINTHQDKIGDKLYEELNEKIENHENTLIFTNTRSGAERVLKNLRQKYPAEYTEDNSGCHHGSLGKEKRINMEEKLKIGDIDFVTTSTSLELGIDMPKLDLVIQIGSPKSVSKLLQRVGRSGHALHHTIKGRIFALDRDELLECAVMVNEAENGFIDRIYIPENCLDVLAQHVYGMAINSVKNIDEIKSIVRKSYCYEDLTNEDFENVIKYLTADYAGMEEKNVYAKIWYDEETGEIGKRGKLARMIYMTNIGTIPASFSCDVFTRENKNWVGSLDEQYLDKLEKGDVFYLGGDRYEFRYRRGGKVYVDKTEKPSNVPRWFSERLPLSHDLAGRILEFKGKFLDIISKKGYKAAREDLSKLSIDENSVESIINAFQEQILYTGKDSISRTDLIYIEEFLDHDRYRRNLFFQSTYGRKFNDGLSRLIAKLVSDKVNTNVSVSMSDFGFTISIPMNRTVDIEKILNSIDISSIGEIMRKALKGTEMLKRIFRIDAVRSFMILENYKGNRKSGRRQQFNSDMMINFALEKDDFAVVEETFREILYDKLNIEYVRDFIDKIQSEDIEVIRKSVNSPSPFMFGIATLQSSDVILAEDKSDMIKQFHHNVINDIKGNVKKGD